MKRTSLTQTLQSQEWLPTSLGTTKEFVLPNQTRISRWLKKMSPCLRVSARRNARLDQPKILPTFSIWPQKRELSGLERCHTLLLPKSLETTKIMACLQKPSKLVRCAKTWTCVLRATLAVFKPKLTFASFSLKKRSGNLRYKWQRRLSKNCKRQIWKVMPKPSLSIVFSCRPIICLNGRQRVRMRSLMPLKCLIIIGVRIIRSTFTFMESWLNCWFSRSKRLTARTQPTSTKLPWDVVCEFSAQITSKRAKFTWTMPACSFSNPNRQKRLQRLLLREMMRWLTLWRLLRYITITLTATSMIRCRLLKLQFRLRSFLRRINGLMKLFWRLKLPRPLIRMYTRKIIPWWSKPCGRNCLPVMLWRGKKLFIWQTSCSML